MNKTVLEAIRNTANEAEQPRYGYVAGKAITSIKAYRELIKNGKARRQQDRVFYFIDRNPGYTRSEIAESLQLPLQSVCGRVGALLKLELVAEGAPRRCTITCSVAKTLFTLTDRSLNQLDLFGGEL